MDRNISRILSWVAFAIAAAGFTLVVAPRPVRGQDTFITPQLSIGADAGVEPAPPSFAPQPVYEAAPAVLGTAENPQYWIVSSRCDVQHRRHKHLDDGELDVYQRSPDGQLFSSNLATLQSLTIPGVPVLICFHGSFVTWEDECNESHQAYQWIRNACPHLPLQVIFFTWPSDGIITGLIPTDVLIRGRQAEFNGFHAARVITCLPPSCPISMIGHSHGCRVILSTLHLAGGGDVQGMTYPAIQATPRRYRAVFAAAAVDHHWMNPKDRYGCALPVTECIINLQNRKDLALAVYPLHRPFAGRALGRIGLLRRDTRKLGGETQKITNLDVTEIEGHNHLWPGYFQSPEIAAAIAPVIYYPGVAQHQAAPSYEQPMIVPTEATYAPVEPTPVPETAPAPILPEVPAAPDLRDYNPPADDFRRP
jgi:esterase/lipase superfamily enzyme